MDSNAKDVDTNGYQDLKNIQQSVQSVKAHIGINQEKIKNNFFN